MHDAIAGGGVNQEDGERKTLNDLLPGPPRFCALLLPHRSGTVSKQMWHYESPTSLLLENRVLPHNNSGEISDCLLITHTHYHHHQLTSIFHCLSSPATKETEHCLAWLLKGHIKSWLTETGE